VQEFEEKDVISRKTLSANIYFYANKKKKSYVQQKKLSKSSPIQNLVLLAISSYTYT